MRSVTLSHSLLQANDRSALMRKSSIATRAPHKVTARNVRHKKRHYRYKKFSMNFPRCRIRHIVQDFKCNVRIGLLNLGFPNFSLKLVDHFAGSKHTHATNFQLQQRKNDISVSSTTNT